MRKAWKYAGLGLLNLLALVAAIAAVQPLLRKFVPHMAGAAVLALVCCAVYVAGSKWIERRVPSELDVDRALPETAAGLLLGVLIFSAVMGILWAFRVYHPSGIGDTDKIVSGFVSALLAGILEEIMFRGLLFRLSAKIVGTWGALLFTSALFGAAHAFNPGATVSSSLAIALEAGILLGAAYAATQRLWLPIGLHVGWNFTEGSLFSMSVSGGSSSSGVIRGSMNGPQILTGGQFGPEASIVAVITCVVAALYFIYSVIKLHRVAPPAWRSTISHPVADAVR